jgi:hypothetical protein
MRKLVGAVAVNSTDAVTKAYVDARYFAVPLTHLNSAANPAARSSVANTECFLSTKITRNRLDLVGYTQVRLVSMVLANGGTPAASIKLSYATTEAATWSGTDVGCSIVLGTGTAGLLRDSGWVTLPVGARVANVTIACLVGVAFGASAPTISTLVAYFR